MVLQLSSRGERSVGMRIHLPALGSLSPTPILAGAQTTEESQGFAVTPRG